MMTLKLYFQTELLLFQIHTHQGKIVFGCKMRRLLCCEHSKLTIKAQRCSQNIFDGPFSPKQFSYCLIHFMPLVSFYTHENIRKLQKISDNLEDMKFSISHFCNLHEFFLFMHTFSKFWTKFEKSASTEDEKIHQRLTERLEIISFTIIPSFKVFDT